VLDLVHALADADGRREVKDRVDTGERAPHGGGIAHVSANQLDVRVEVRRAIDGAVYLRR
jgi:hypothetical protein